MPGSSISITCALPLTWSVSCMAVVLRVREGYHGSASRESGFDAFARAARPYTLRVMAGLVPATDVWRRCEEKGCRRSGGAERANVGGGVVGFPRQSDTLRVMAGLVPATHALRQCQEKRRGHLRRAWARSYEGLAPTFD